MNKIISPKVLFSLVLITIIIEKSIAQLQPALGYRSTTILKKKKLLFKDLNKNGKLDNYEDWRLPQDIRIKDLISQMTMEEKVGFMLISTTRMQGDYTFDQNKNNIPPGSGFNEDDLIRPNNLFTGEKLSYPLLMAVGTTKAVNQLHLRHFILRANNPAQMIATWHNNLQALCEKSRLGIPAIVASNPRNHITIDASAGLSVGTGAFTKWPGELGIAAMRDLRLTRKFAEIARSEWTAVGLRKGYQYMADLATEPRWQRIEGTFGEDADLAANIIREVVLGFQGEKLNNTSVALTTKHFPGGGPQVDGFDPHFSWGKDQHYPGNKFDYHLKPFIAAIGAGTSAIMPYYAKPIGTKYEELAFAYNKAIIKDLLRVQLGFNGIINSDTGPIEMMPWGVENLSIVERYKLAVDCGVDLFSGTGDPSHLLEAVQTGLISNERINESIYRLLKEKFDLGLFENPYVDEKNANSLVGAQELQKIADTALRKSIVLLRNEKKLLPVKPKTKVYFEKYYDAGRNKTPFEIIAPSSNNKWDFEFVQEKDEADLVILWLIPTAGGLFSSSPVPIELQLSKNKIDISRVNTTTYHKPTVLVINYSSPWVIDEIDNPNVHTVLATFGTSTDAILDVLSGQFVPSGKMPITTPRSNKAVLQNLSDVPGHSKAGNYALFKFGDGINKF